MSTPDEPQYPPLPNEPDEPAYPTPSRPVPPPPPLQPPPAPYYQAPPPQQQPGSVPYYPPQQQQQPGSAPYYPPPQQQQPGSAPYYPPQQQQPGSAPYYPPQQQQPGSAPYYPPPQQQYPASSPYSAPMPPSAPYGGQFGDGGAGYPAAQPWPTPEGGVATMAPPTSPLARAFPFWVPLIGALIILGILGGVATTGADWAASGVRVGITAGIIAVVLVAFAGIRLALGLASAANTRRAAQLIGAGVAVVALLVVALLGIAAQNPLHRAQAATLATGGQYQRAIDELKLAGESAPNSVAIASVYNAWGHAQINGQHYQDAITTFNIVLTDYSGAGGQVTAAQQGTVTAFEDKAQSEAHAQQYHAATTDLDALLNLSYCDSACQSTAKTSDATAYFAIGQQQLTANDCSGAATTYSLVITRFPSSNEAGQASTALKAPQAVTGSVDLGPPGTGASQVTATVELFAAVPASTTVSAILADSKAATLKTPVSALAAVDAYAFTQVPPGTYNMVISLTDTTFSITVSAVALDPATSAYRVLTVAPLCAANLGTTPFTSSSNYEVVGV